MPEVKIATFNLEWLVSAFGARWKKWPEDPSIVESFPGAKLGDIELEPIADVPAMCKRIAGVIRDTKAKIIGTQEAPPLQEQMELFVKRFLDDDYAVFYSNSQWQTIGALVHKSIAERVTAWQPALPQLPTTYWTNIPYYPWGLIGTSDRANHQFARRPLLLSYGPKQGKELKLMILHTKSKYSKLKTVEQWENRDREAVLDALEARAKLSAEAFRVRKFLNECLTQIPSLPIVLMGDLNDGPFAELLEQEFLLHNIVDELVGSVLDPDSYFRHAMALAVLRTAASTRFPDPLEGGAIVQELIDHVLISPSIWQANGAFRLQPSSCTVEAKAYDAHFDPAGDTQRGLRPSDHRPVSAVFEWS
jgi:endonuclease/exonuclease/phosphatase family metal-dependent hydrolase